MSTLILPAPTIDEQEAEDFDPIPQIALAGVAGSVMTRFHLALPVGPRSYRARFDDLTHLPDHTCLTGAHVRYSELIAPTLLLFSRTLIVDPVDEVVVTVHRA